MMLVSLDSVSYRLFIFLWLVSLLPPHTVSRCLSKINSLLSSLSFIILTSVTILRQLPMHTYQALFSSRLQNFQSLYSQPSPCCSFPNLLLFPINLVSPNLISPQQPFYTLQGLTNFSIKRQMVSILGFVYCIQSLSHIFLFTCLLTFKQLLKV